MNNKVFGEVTFKTGWKLKDYISYFGEKKDITVTAESYSESELITNEQENSFVLYKNDNAKIIVELEKCLKNYEKNAEKRFLPTELIFDRKGNCALLLDDKNNPDEGIAVTIMPKMTILSQDEYL